MTDAQYDYPSMRVRRQTYEMIRRIAKETGLPMTEVVRIAVKRSEKRIRAIAENV